MSLLGGFGGRLFFILEQTMEDFTYQVIRSQRKTISIQILPDGRVVIRCNYRTPEREIQRILSHKAQWIQTHLSKKVPAAPKLTQDQLQQLAEKARLYLPKRVALYAPRIGVTYGRITIRNQRTRWGSCSGKGNLNFNCMLMLAPEAVIDYVVIHELCHRKEMNHSANFWALVQRHCPDYPQLRKWLKEHGSAILAQMP